MDTSKIAALKEAMIKATSFYPVWDYFFDHIVTDPGFLAAGRPIRNKLLLELIAGIAQCCMEKRPLILALFFIEIPGTDFIHGTGMIDDSTVALFYFKDTAAGMLAVVGPDGKSRVARFTGTVIESKQ